MGATPHIARWVRRALVLGVLAAATAPAKRTAAGPARRDAAPGAPAQRVSLDELVATAVRHSPGLAIAYADRSEGEGRDTSADAVDEWHAIAQINAQDTVLDRSLAGPSAALDDRQFNAEVGLQRNLSTGGSVTLTASTGQVRYVYPGPQATPASAAAAATFNDTTITGETAAARLVASQPLLRGAGASVARADQHTAQLAAHALTAQAEDEAAQLVHDLVLAYWELAYAVQTRVVDREGEELAERQLTITQGVVRAGVQPPSALKVAELQVALRGETIIHDEATIVDQSLSVRRLAGLPLTAAPLAPSDLPELPTDRWHEDRAVAAAIAHGPAIAQKDLAQRQASIAVDVAHDGRLPKLDLKLSGELDGFGPTTGEAFNQLGAGQAYAVTASLSLTWDLGGAARAADGAARAHRDRVDAERTDLERQLAAQATSAINQLRLAAKRLELAELAVEVAEEALHAEVVAFQGGRSTNVLVFQRQDDLAQAKLKIARARIDGIEANATLDYLTGRLLAHHGVTLDRSRP
ncbi:MAG TPA: TolC family protein [Kofleriaceae bacterium]|jgi:outer membrane protein TolC|nr:TolC family protein [Kofleriaceae bacterium]